MNLQNGSEPRVDDLRARWGDALAALDRGRAHAVGAEAIETIGAAAFADRVVRHTLDAFGRAWLSGARSLAEVYMTGRISAEVVEPLLPKSASRSPVALAVLDDFHLLGKQLVGLSLWSAGVPTRDLGRLGADALAEAAVEHEVGLLMVSTLMLRAALQVERLRARLDALGAPTRIVVGGAPFRIDGALWRTVGAHDMGQSADDAVRIASTWLEMYG